jgi:uracil-DNA glycosylase
LGSCAATSERHIRSPENETGDKEPSRIRSLVVGLNPGLSELNERRYFVGSAGGVLASKRYAALWEKCPASETLVTNIVKIVTKDATELKSVEVSALRSCVADCFLAEVRALPYLKHVYVLGIYATTLFYDLVWPQLDAGVSVFSLRHPSHASVVPNLDEVLRRGLDEPFLFRGP